MLEKQNETHYRRATTAVEVTWTSDTKLVTGKAEGIRAGAEVNSQFSSTFHRQVLSSTASSQRRGLFILPGANKLVESGASET
jgi:hypothetical protein